MRSRCNAVAKQPNENRKHDEWKDGQQMDTGYALIPRPASSFRISPSVSIFFSCVASSRSPFWCFSFSSSMAFNCGRRVDNIRNQ